MLRWSSGGLVAATCLAFAVTAPGSAQRREVLVSAATSLSEVMEELGRAYEARTGIRITVNLGASNTLARQILAGAAVDLFISADEAQMEAIRTQTVPGSRVNLLSNQLAIAVPADRPRTLRTARELTQPMFARIAVGDPSAVPAGVYAKAYLEKLGIWAAVSRKIVPSASVRLALAAVENGAADAAIVYRTDLAAARRASLALVIPASEGPRILYPAALVRAGRNRDEAARFLAWLRGPEATAILTRAGFAPLAQEGDEGRPKSRPLPQARELPGAR